MGGGGEKIEKSKARNGKPLTSCGGKNAGSTIEKARRKRWDEKRNDQYPARTKPRGKKENTM